MSGGGGRVGRLLRVAGEDTVQLIRDWRPPERPEPVDPRSRAARGRRAPEPTWGRRPTAETVRRNLQKRVLFPFLDVMSRPEVIGLDNVLRVRPPIIIAPNHTSHADAPTVLQALPDHIRERTLVPAAADYFFDRAWLSVVVTLTMNGVPFDRRHDIADSVRRCERFLRHGHSIVLFPEGSRSSDGRLRGFKAGVAHLAVQTGAPVIPVYIRGTHALLRRGKALPRRSAVAVHFGSPLHPAEDETAREFNSRLEEAVSCLAEAARHHARHEVRPPTPGWRTRWDASAPRPTSETERAVPAGGSWIDSWRSTTPR